MQIRLLVSLLSNLVAWKSITSKATGQADLLNQTFETAISVLGLNETTTQQCLESKYDKFRVQ